MLARFSPYFRCDSVVYKGSPAVLLILHNWALRIPQSWKAWYAVPLTAVDKAGTADFDKAEASGTPLTLTPESPPQALSRVLPLDLSVVELSQ